MAKPKSPRAVLSILATSGLVGIISIGCSTTGIGCSIGNGSGTGSDIIGALLPRICPISCLLANAFCKASSVKLVPVLATASAID